MTDKGSLEIIWRVIGMEIHIGPVCFGLNDEFDCVGEQVFAMDKGWA